MYLDKVMRNTNLKYREAPITGALPRRLGRRKFVRSLIRLLQCMYMCTYA